MVHHHNSATSEPSVYLIKVHGTVSESWAGGTWVVKARHPVGKVETELVGKINDQATLIDMINTLHNLGHALIRVVHIAPEEKLDKRIKG